MAQHFAWSGIAIVSIWYWGCLVLGVPTPDTSSSTTTSATPTKTVETATSTGTSTSTSLSSVQQPTTSSSLTRYSDFITKANYRTIILVVVFLVVPLVALWFCCFKKKFSCLFRHKEKRQHYNAAHPTQIPGGVYLVPVNAFVPTDGRTGYTVRVDTPANPTEAATAAPPIFAEVTLPPRAASPLGQGNEKWKTMFKV
jgi:hypothetical protein